MNENEYMVQRAVHRHQEAFIPMVFDRKERKLVRNQLMVELEQGFEHRRRALDLVLDTLHQLTNLMNLVEDSLLFTRLDPHREAMALTRCKALGFKVPVFYEA